MSDKRLVPDGQGGFHSLPDGGRLTPDGQGGFHILSGGSFSGYLVELLMWPMILLSIPCVLLVGTYFVFGWIVLVPAGLIFGQAFLDTNGGFLAGIAAFLTIAFWIAMLVVFVAKKMNKKK